MAKHGCEIAQINTDAADELSLGAVKGATTVELNVAFNKKTEKSTSTDADSMWTESEATSRERERQEVRQ